MAGKVSRNRMMDMSASRAIVDLVPKYAHARRSGWVPPLVSEVHVSLSDYLILRRIAIESDAPLVPLADLRSNARNPYATVDPFLDDLSHLVERQLLIARGDLVGLAPRGRVVLKHGEPAANDYAARRIRLSAQDLGYLADVLSLVTECQWQSSEPACKAHQGRGRRLRQFDPRETAPVRLEFAMYGLQRARDDAHIAAWKAAGFHGPDIQLLSLLWTGRAGSAHDLREITGVTFRQDDVDVWLDDLEQLGVIDCCEELVSITPQGRETRNAIEQETDRIYFSPWPPLDTKRVIELLTELAAGFS